MEKFFEKIRGYENSNDPSASGGLDRMPNVRTWTWAKECDTLLHERIASIKKDQPRINKEQEETGYFDWNELFL